MQTFSTCLDSCDTETLTAQTTEMGETAVQLMDASNYIMLFFKYSSGGRLVFLSAF